MGKIVGDICAKGKIVAEQISWLVIQISWLILVVFLSIFPFSVLIMASTGFLIFCGFPEYWFSYRWFFL